MDQEGGSRRTGSSSCQRTDHVDHPGSVRRLLQGKKYVMHAGDIMIIPPNVPHGFHFTEDTIDIDVFSPLRQDWMDGTTAYYPKT